MSVGHAARELELLDALSELEPVAHTEPVWRAVREGRDPVQGHPSAGRWDPGRFDVIYTALAPEGAVAEIHFHLSRQPVFPSKLRFALYEVRVRTERTLKLADMAALTALGVEEGRYREILYHRTQEIGDAAYFLGFDGLTAPSARWPCQNLVLFTERLEPAHLEAGEPAWIDWQVWQQKLKDRPGTG
jgi:RES domain-containing protein